MTEVASVKVVLLDIGKEQRRRKKKSDEAPDGSNAMRPVRQSGNLHPPIDTKPANPDPD